MKRMSGRVSLRIGVEYDSNAQSRTLTVSFGDLLLSR